MINGLIRCHVDIRPTVRCTTTKNIHTQMHTLTHIHPMNKLVTSDKGLGSKHLFFFFKINV